MQASGPASCVSLLRVPRNFHARIYWSIAASRQGPGEVLPYYMGYLGMRVPKNGPLFFSRFGMIDRVSSLAILVINRVWFLRSCLELDCEHSLPFPSLLEVTAFFS